MIINTCIFLVTIGLFALFIYAVKERNKIIDGRNKTISEYSFQSWEKADLPFITIDVNGHKLNMIADSAGAVSVIRKDVLKDIDYEPNSRKIDLVALSDEGNIKSNVVAIPITINGKEVKTDFVVYDRDDIAGFKRHGIVMDGLLGVEFFKATNGMIDFQKQTVKFP